MKFRRFHNELDSEVLADSETDTLVDTDAPADSDADKEPLNDSMLTSEILKNYLLMLKQTPLRLTTSYLLILERILLML